MKESNPFEVEEYAKTRGVGGEPDFTLWVPCVMRKRDTIVTYVIIRARNTSHKHGIEVPASVEHACCIGRNNGNDFWIKLIKK